MVKPNTYRLAGEAGVAVPHCYGPASRVTAQRTDISYPVVVKPQVSAAFWERFGKKLIVAQSPLELVAAIDHIERAGLVPRCSTLCPDRMTSSTTTPCTWISRVNRLPNSPSGN